MDGEERNLKAFFTSKGVNLPDEWLQSCINWCKTETLPANYTAGDLQLKVYAQWLLQDLRDVESPVLPPGLSSQKDTVLHGKYCLQLMKVIDVSKPKLWQLQRLRRNLTKNVDPDKDFGNRVLLLHLTDGTSDVEGMEFKPIKCLSINLRPGAKVMIYGPVKVRRGQLMLEEKHIRVLGGEVEELLVVNHPENVLARELGMEENPNPGVIEEKLLEVPEEKPPQETQNNVAMNISTGTNNVIVPQMNDDTKKLDREIDDLLEVEREFEQKIQERGVKNKSPDLFDDADLNDEAFAQLDEIVKESEKKSINNRGETVSDVRNVTDKPKVDTESEFPTDLDLELDQKIEVESVEVKPPKSNVITLANLLKNKENINNGKFKVKIKFTEVVEKLSFEDGSFKMVIKIADETTQATVKVHNDVVSDLVGYCPSVLQALKQKIADKDQEATNTVFSALLRLKTKLIELDNVVILQVSKNEPRPVLVGII